MRSPDCARCAGPVPDQAYVCPTCGELLHRALLRLAAYAGEIQTDVARQARHAAIITAGGHEPPLPYNPTAADRAWAVGNTVVTWAFHVADHRGAPPPPAPGRLIGPQCRHGVGCRHDSCQAIRNRRTEHPIARAARWLARHVDWLRHRPEAAEAVDELLDAANVARRTIDSPGDTWYAGPCGEPLTAGDECPADLYVHHGAQVVRCAACGAQHDAQARQAWLLDVARDTLGTAALLAASATALGRHCTAAAIRGYAHRGRIVAHGTDAWSRPTYRLGDVLDVLDQVADQGATTRRGSAA